VESETKRAFAVWITGLPASGKSTLTAALNRLLAARGVDVAILESDALRQVFTPHPTYDDEEREHFYRQMVYIGRLLVEHGVRVVFDATANRRVYRDRAREQIPQFLEVYVETSLSTCMARDPKGIYRKDQQGGADAVPGIQAIYEPPERPDLVVRGDQEPAETAAARVVATLLERRYL
jgi:adenylylsulfate kinase